MFIFYKIKDKFTKKTGDEVTTKYEKGLEKTRNEFVSKLNLLVLNILKLVRNILMNLKKFL